MAIDPTDLWAELAYAKRAVRWLLEHPNGLIDMHGLAYWAGRVETIRKQIGELL